MSSARDLPRSPTRPPAFTPTPDSTRVVRPMRVTAGRIFTFRKAKVMPTVRASMLVATARGSMAAKPKEAPTSSSSWLRDSRTMLPPMRHSRKKAIQWSTVVIRLWKPVPSSQPARGIRAWKPPNHSPAVSICFQLVRPAERPLQMETAKASIERPTAMINSSHRLIFQTSSSFWCKWGQKKRPICPLDR